MSDCLFALLIFALLLMVYRATTPRDGREWRCQHWRGSHSIKTQSKPLVKPVSKPKRATPKTKAPLSGQIQPSAGEIKANIMDDSWWKTLV